MIETSTYKSRVSEWWASARGNKLFWRGLAGAAAIIILDQATKEIARLTLSPILSTAYLDGMLRFVYAENTGIIFSIGVGLPDSEKHLLFTLLPSVLFLILLISCSMIIGGGISNILDRLTNHGAVVDFVYILFWGGSTGIFNLADVMISAGCAILLARFLIRLRAKDQVSNIL